MTDAEFNDIFFPMLMLAESVGIREALERTKLAHPELADRLESAAAEDLSIEFLCGEPEEIEPLTESQKWRAREALGNAKGEYVHTDSARFVWNGEAWTDALGNSHSKLDYAIGFWEDM